jgi:hypothetical protein
MTYTFNGKGEFVLVRADTVRHKLDIQARFEAIPNNIYGTARATVLTAVAGKQIQTHTKNKIHLKFDLVLMVDFSIFVCSSGEHLSGRRSSYSSFLRSMAVSFRCDCRSALRLL